jgi:UDP-3-O-[3-hydroxymyristoyl] glucosamine N-acyltransferase
MEFTAKQIAQYVGGRVVGNENTTVSDFAKIEEGRKGAISFLSNPKYTHFIYETESSIVLIDEGVNLEKPVKATLIVVKNAYDSIARLLQLYENSKPKKNGISDLAFISSKAKIGVGVYVGAFSYIGDGAIVGDNCQIYPNVYIGEGVKVGDRCLLYPHVTIYHGCHLGNNVTIHAGSVIGADGFGFAPTPEGYDKIPQIGIVTIEDNVEIGANSCVDRSTMGSTYVRKGVKLDNLVQIAHNDDIGANTVISAQTGIAGSTTVGQWCMFGGQVGLAGHITIGNKVMLGAQSGVLSSIKDNQVLIGTLPMEKTPYFKTMALLKKLPDLYKQIYTLEKEVEELKNKK